MACSTTPLGFGGEADQQPRAQSARAKLGEDVAGAAANLSCGGPVAFLELVRRRLDPPVGDGGDEDRGVGGQRREHRFGHLLGGFDVDALDAGGVASATGPATSVTRAPASAAAAAIANPCRPDERLAITRTGSIGSCVGPGGDEDMLARQASLQQVGRAGR